MKYIFFLANITREVGDSCNNNKSTGLLFELQKAYPSNLATSFCSSSCPCKAIRGRFPLTAEYESAVFQASGASNVMECKKSLYTSNSPSKEAISFMKLLEERYRCSGICKKEKWFYFSNVALGSPLFGCSYEILNYIEERFTIIYGIVIASAIIALISPIPAILLLCIKSRPNP